MATEEKSDSLERRADAFIHCVHGLVLVDVQTGRVITCNPAFAGMRRSTVEETNGREMRSLHVDRFHETLAAGMRKADEGGRVQYQAEMLRDDNTTFPVDVTLVSVKDPQGRPAFRVATVLDLTSQRRSEQDIAMTEERFRLLAENSKDLVFRYRTYPTPAYEYVSPSSRTLTGYSPEEYYADPFLDLKMIHPEDKESLERVRQNGEIYDGKPVVLRIHRKDGRLVWMEQINSFFFDDRGLLYIEGSSRDVTERIQAETALRTAAKLDSLGVLWKKQPDLPCPVRA